jgi:hypothetical protein
MKLQLLLQDHRMRPFAIDLNAASQTTCRVPKCGVLLLHV